MKVKLINDSFKNCDYGAQLLQSRGIVNVPQFMAPDASVLQSWRDLEYILDGMRLITNLKEDAKIAIVVD